MKKIFTYIACALVAFGAISCAKDGLKLPEQEKDGLTLRFSLGELSTKADGETTRLAVGNEDRVNKIDYFFFKVVDGVISEDTAPLIDMRTITPDDKLAIDYELTLNSADLKLLYPNADDQVAVYAIANYTGEYPETVTLAALKAIEVRSTFAENERWPHPLATNDNDLYFIMTGELVLDLTAAENIVELNRLASKVTVEFTWNDVADTREPDRIIWKPQYEGKETRVYLSNAIATTTLGGPLGRTYVTDSGSTFTDGTRDIFEYSYDYLTDLKGATPYYYTYPINMEAGDDNQPYIKLVLPWYAYEKSSLTATTGEDGKVVYTVPEGVYPIKQKEVYYKIALPIDDLKEGNKIYEYTADITIVGADMEVEIDATYYVKNWSNNGPISSNLATGRYISLDIPKDTYDMYSSLAQILFVSSGEVDVIVNSISQMFLGGNTPEPKYFMQDNVVTAASQTVNIGGQNRNLLQLKGITEDDIEDWVTVPAGTSILTIEHTLVNDVNDSAFDMAPYVYDITLHLREGDEAHAFDKRVVITQYPSMYVTSLRSNGYVYVKGNTYSTNTAGTNPESTYVYNDAGTNQTNRIGSVTNRATALSTLTNNNGYNMIIHPTVLDPSLKLVLGDARVDAGSTLANLNGLSSYKPTRTDLTNIVSPGFMIASSYGKTSTVASSIDRAKERCASYQESGFPPGRWRIPTEGEIEFLVTLSNKGFIPSLFDGRYWAASNRFYYSGDSNFHSTSEIGNNAVAVRCVYDVWYWGETPMKANGTDATNYNEGTRTWTDAATTWIGYKD